ncbi:MAG TPA: hypothetical protein PLB91_10995 [Spirochaetales bacterium]|nr:hypothetical protein [Spirochaetales bacterium]HRY55906.1 hypothetical protein [Spirochaetia bacterium]HRZ64371.1 hypothetical protein [Spirochaetia bacterium]
MCSFCGAPLPSERKPGFNETCESCGKDLHSCRNCRFYKAGARWDCAETIESPVPDKDRRNYCEWFEADPRLSSGTEGRKGERDAAAEARRRLDSLFGG